MSVRISPRYLRLIGMNSLATCSSYNTDDPDFRSINVAVSITGFGMLREASRGGRHGTDGPVRLRNTCLRELWRSNEKVSLRKSSADH